MDITKDEGEFMFLGETVDPALGGENSSVISDDLSEIHIKEAYTYTQSVDKKSYKQEIKHAREKVSYGLKPANKMAVATRMKSFKQVREPVKEEA